MEKYRVKKRNNLKDKVDHYLKKYSEVTYEKREGVDYRVEKDDKRERIYAVNSTLNPIMIEVIVNDRYGSKERIKVCPSDTIKDLKRLVSAKIGTKWQKIRLQKATKILHNKISLEDYEIKHGMSIEMYYD